MKRTPFDYLIAGDAKEDAGQAKRRKPWLDQRQQFEEDVVEYLLDHYELAGTKTRLHLLEERKFLCSAEPKQFNMLVNALTLDAFNIFFPKFPVLLFAQYLRRPAAARMTFPRMLLHFDHTPLGRPFFEAAEDDVSELPLAFIFHWPYVALSDSPAVHDYFPANVRVPGLHALYTRASDAMMCLVETLEALLDSIDAEDPKHEWLASAKQDNFAESARQKEQ